MHSGQPDGTDLQIIAQQGEGVYLLVPIGSTNRTLQAQVLDTNRGILFRPRGLQTVLAQGYWREYEGSQHVLQGLLSEVEAQ